MDIDFKNTFTQNLCAVAVIDSQGVITKVTEKFSRLTGFSCEQLTDTRHQDLTPERWKRYETNVIAKKVMAKGHAKYEKEIVCADGRNVPVELDVFLLRADGGQPVGMWATVKPIDDLNCDLDCAIGK